ncbi:MULTISPECIES: hypothetical protein [Bacillales]|uniref:hypothetical protein n=1 Tax=Bacillales TaxID=1385 RepID=UPI0003F73330|nr:MULTISPECIES: hypothetical protein [Bacillales]MDN4094598.1 hypothetical protein [Brevibacillus agri]MED0677507.1 hypothetical protein [Aneurinibacillus thermoaerophilus]MED3500524.1 hypothetical protein [Brevibacillus agri]
MFGAIQIGPFAINAGIFTFILCSLLGYLAIKKRLENEKGTKDVISQMVMNLIFITFVLWKFSYVIFHPLETIRHPISIIYFSGGERGIWLAGIATIVYITVQIARKRILINVTMDTFATGLLIAWGVGHAIWLAVERYELFYHLLQIVVSVILYVWVIRKISVGNIKEWLPVLMWFCIGQILALFFTKSHLAFFLGFSKIQFVFLFLSSIIMVLDYSWKKSDNFKET